MAMLESSYNRDIMAVEGSVSNKPSIFGTLAKPAYFSINYSSPPAVNCNHQHTFISDSDQPGGRLFIPRDLLQVKQNSIFLPNMPWLDDTYCSGPSCGTLHVA